MDTVTDVWPFDLVEMSLVVVRQCYSTIRLMRVASARIGCRNLQATVAYELTAPQTRLNGRLARVGWASCWETDVDLYHIKHDFGSPISATIPSLLAQH